MEGLYCDNTEEMALINTIKCPKLTESTVLTVVHKKTRAEPYAFTGIKWATIKLTMATNRDLCYFEKMGMVRQRAQVSLCYLFEELEDDVVGVFMQGEVDSETMTFPNRSSYDLRKRRSFKSVAKTMKATVAMQKKLPMRRSRAAVRSEGMQQELTTMLSSLSQGECAQPMPNREDTMQLVESSRKRLFDDNAFKGNESFQRMLLFAKNPVVQNQPGSVDPLAAAVEKMPQSYQGFSSIDSSRSQYMEAVAMQNMADAVAQVKDPCLQTRYEQTAQHLHAWGERRMQQQEPQPSMERSGNVLPSLSMSLSHVSPYALELAARNSLPKKRSSLSKLSKKLMHEWFEHNLHHPYPTEEEKEWLAHEGGITMEQVNNWFINTRGRKWKPMLNRLMAEKQAGNCTLYDKMVKKIEEPYRQEQ
ncbi:hypothetical protein PHPALM_31276 [Phytophthora palmivora]|uniref:Homeobox domain-containing protein n=1 Tax=Phytophthora palmivora TaxID=4796 RepID=A0A2P4X302_9STRA|nr:hypothetical protein PHPALM_31276 [Phytophthora palmivora]